MGWLSAYDECYLIHYGVSGQKKGYRRWQNPDGTLTEEGKRHYQELGEPNDPKAIKPGWSVKKTSVPSEQTPSKNEESAEKKNVINTIEQINKVESRKHAGSI